MIDPQDEPARKLRAFWNKFKDGGLQCHSVSENQAPEGGRRQNDNYRLISELVETINENMTDSA